MTVANRRKKWVKEQVLEIYTTPEEKYPELAKKFGRTLGAIKAKHRTKEEINKIRETTRFVRKTNPDKWMWELFAKGKNPKM